MSAVTRQLPRGRHRLPREQVLASQRGRMLAAMAEAVAELGFARTTVAEVVRRSGVSRETFYEQFSDKEDCFLALLDAGAEKLLDLLAGVLEQPAEDPIERLDRVLDAYLKELTRGPGFAKAYLIDAYGAGPRVTARRIELQERFVNLMIGFFVDSEGPEASDRFACEALVAAVSSLVAARVETGRARELPALRVPFVELARQLPLTVGARGPRRRSHHANGGRSR